MSTPVGQKMQQAATEYFDVKRKCKTHYQEEHSAKDCPYAPTTAPKQVFFTLARCSNRYHSGLFPANVEE